MMAETVLLWFRQDLRLSDNPALCAAAADSLPIVPLFIKDAEAEGNWALGGASRVWLNGSLKQLKEDLQALQSNLIIRQGDSLAHLLDIAGVMGANRIHCHHRYEPWARKQQAKLQLQLAQEGVELILHSGGTLLWEPDDVCTNNGKPYQVFTPFFKKCLEHPPHTDLFSIPKYLPSPKSWPDSLPLEALELLPHIAWHSEIQQFWIPGEKMAQKRLQQFIESKQKTYGTHRDFPAENGTSLLSPYLHCGEISPRQIWAAVTEQSERTATSYLRELIWREFAYHILYHFPQTTEQPLRQKFESFPWKNNSHLFSLWCQGKTGYPIVDAGLRQLWKMGWMHNRVRMIVGSFLTKDLLLSWQDGAHWFWDTLVDADLANNTLGWQWVSGCGADAQPFFRIFNPVMQSKKFDPNGEYIRHWLPELTKLPVRYIHEPWNAPSGVLKEAGIVLGETYPEPIVDHAWARAEAMKYFKQMQSNRGND